MSIEIEKLALQVALLSDEQKNILISKLGVKINDLKARLNNAIYFQEKAKSFISHSEDCNAITEPDELEESGESCQCGMDKFAYDNHLSIQISKEVLK